MALAVVLSLYGRDIDIWFGTDEWERSMEWARFHGLDPNRIPAGTTIAYDSDTRTLHWCEYATDDKGNIIAPEDGAVIVDRMMATEAGPLPFAA